MTCENCNHDKLAHGTHGCFVGSALDESQHCNCPLDYSKEKVVTTTRCSAQAEPDTAYPYLQCERAYDDPHTEGYHRACIGSYTEPDGTSQPSFFCWTVVPGEVKPVANPDRTVLSGGARSQQVGGNHYRKFKIQPWDVIDEYGLNFYLGNVVKYVLRSGHKGIALEDLKKARHYLDRVIEIEEGK